MKKILTSLFNPLSTLIIEDTDPAYHSAGQAPAAAAPVQHVEALPLPGSSCLSQENPSAPAGSGQADPASFRNMESVLNRPGIACVGDQIIHNLPAAHGAVAPLALPVLHFDPPGKKKTAAPATRQAPAANGVEPLPLPVMDFKAA